MNVVLAGGVELDLLTGEEAERKLDALRNGIVRDLRSENLLPLADAGVMPSSGVLVLDLGSPAMGRFWDVRRVVAVQGNDPTAEPAGRVLLLATAQVPLSATAGTAIPALSVFDASSALPATFTYSSHQAVVQGTEHLIAVFSGVAAAVNLAVTALVVEEDSHYITNG